MAKPNKRQRAILELVNIVEGEGLHYGVVNYGVSDQVKALKDKKLTELVETFIKTSEKLEERIEDLKSEVQEFLDDDSDF